MHPQRSWKNEDVLEELSDLLVTRGCPEFIRNDTGSEFTPRALRKWLSDIGVTTTYMKPGSPWENG